MREAALMHRKLGMPWLLEVARRTATCQIYYSLARCRRAWKLTAPAGLTWPALSLSRGRGGAAVLQPRRGGTAEPARSCGRNYSLDATRAHR